MRLIVTCPDETKEALMTELKELGVGQTIAGYRSVGFDASEEIFYNLHLRLRSASRILQVIKDIPAKTPPMLFSQARRIKWHELFDAQHSFAVETVGDKDAVGRGELQPLQIITKVREAVLDVFNHELGKCPKVDTRDPKVVIVAHVSQGRCTLSLDTCGKSLHKRGYRESGHPAPVKETLAAAMLTFAGYNGTQTFLDPMCGSGTIAIEAAMIAVAKAPQIHRKKGEFNFEWLKGFNRDLWRKTQEQARAEKREATLAPVIAADINPKFVEMAQKSALQARVEKYIAFHTRRFQDTEAPSEKGIIVTNLPYGDRLSSEESDLKTLYEEIGDTLKYKFAGWRAAILAANDSPHRFIGLKPDRKIPLLNGSIPCKLLIYDIYAGKRATGT